MPKFKLRTSIRTYYEIEVEAESEAELSSEWRDVIMDEGHGKEIDSDATDLEEIIPC